MSKYQGPFSGWRGGGRCAVIPGKGFNSLLTEDTFPGLRNIYFLLVHVSVSHFSTLYPTSILSISSPSSLPPPPPSPSPQLSHALHSSVTLTLIHSVPPHPGAIPSPPPYLGNPANLTTPQKNRPGTNPARATNPAIWSLGIWRTRPTLLLEASQALARRGNTVLELPEKFL